MQPLPTCPDVSVVSKQIASPPFFLSHCGPAEVRMPVHWTDVMPCDKPRPRWAPRAPASAQPNKPILPYAPPPLRTSLGKNISHIAAVVMLGTRPPIGRAMMRHRNRPGSEP